MKERLTAYRRSAFNRVPRLGVRRARYLPRQNTSIFRRKRYVAIC
jgi:hypothetical protein